jgi:hypothetical protein
MLLMGDKAVPPKGIEDRGQNSTASRSFSVRKPFRPKGILGRKTVPVRRWQPRNAIFGFGAKRLPRHRSPAARLSIRRRPRTSGKWQSQARKSY